MHITPDTLPTGHAGIAARFKKGPTIHSSAWVVPGATVIGDVILEEESSVWYGAVLRGDINRIVIGPRSNIQDNAVVHVDTDYPTTMGELVTVGHTAIVHACTIDNEVLVGMGAIILDDVEVGARSIIGANALVTIGNKNSARLTRAWIASENPPATEPRRTKGYCPVGVELCRNGQTISRVLLTNPQNQGQ